MTDPTEAIRKALEAYEAAFASGADQQTRSKAASFLFDELSSLTSRQVREIFDRLDSAERALANVASYWITRSINPIKVECVRQIKGPNKWAIRQGGDCLSKSGEWEWEPMPSSRDDDFLARCRFDTAQEAIDAALRVGAVGGEG